MDNQVSCHGPAKQVSPVWCSTGKKESMIASHPLWLLANLILLASFGMMIGCREPSVSEGKSIPKKPESVPADVRSERGSVSVIESQERHDQAAIDTHLGVVIDSPIEWTVGDDVSIQLAVSNDADQTIDALELRAEIQFGLQDTITEGRMNIAIASLPAGTSYHAVFHFVSSRPGVWYVKAAIYHKSELIKATTRTLYIREARTQPQQQRVEHDEASLGPPLVDHPDRLQRLHPEFPIWIDIEGRSVVMIGRVCQREAPLELFACLKNFKEHESVLSINTRAYIVHAGLLALGVEPGRPVQFYPEYRPAEGPEIDIFVVWKDAEGKIQRAPAQQWVRDVHTKQAMKSAWIFTGSQIVKDEETGEQYYYADSTGELICVSNFPSAVLDLPIRSSDSNEALLFEAFTEHIPPLGTPVTVILTPKSAENSASSPTTAPESSTPPTTNGGNTTDTPQSPGEESVN